MKPSAEPYLISRLRTMLRSSYGLRGRWPAHLEAPYRATAVDVSAYYDRHSAKDDIDPVVSYRVPEGHAFVLDSVSMAANIFQSPSFWDFFNVRLYARKNGHRLPLFSSGQSGWMRAQQIVGPDAPRGSLHDRSPLLYVMNDISPPGTVGPNVNTFSPDDPLTRVRSGHSPVFGLQFAAEGPHRVFRGGDVIDIVYEWISPAEIDPTVGIDGRSALVGVMASETQIGTLNLGRPATTLTFGVPAGDDNSPTLLDDGGLFGVGAFTGAGSPLLVVTAGLTDGIYVASAGIDISTWGGGEQLGVDTGNPALAGTNPFAQPYTVGLKNVFYVFLDRASSQAELDAITWRVGASATNAANGAWSEMRVDDAIYRALPTWPAGAAGGPLFWYEVRFTNTSVAPYSLTRKGWPLSARAHRYVKVVADSIVPGVITAPLDVTEVTVGFEALHPLAARMSGWTYIPEWEGTSAVGNVAT